MKILGVPFSDSASCYFRVYWPLDTLKQLELAEVEYAPSVKFNSDEEPVRLIRVGEFDPTELTMRALQLFPNNRAAQVNYINYHTSGADASKFDMVLFTRRFERETLRLINRLHEVGVRVIYDLDDDPWSVMPENPAYASWGRDGRKVLEWYSRMDRKLPFQPATPQAAAQFTKTMRNGMVACIQLADAITVTTPALKRLFGVHNKNVHVIPNQMKVTEWTNVAAADHPGELWFGWAGSATHWADLAPLEGAVLQVLEQVPDSKFVVVGFPQIKDLFKKVPRSRILAYPYMAIDAYRGTVAGMDVVWSPSAATAFNEAKSDIRVLEAWMCRRPVIASETTYGPTVRTAQGGYVATKPKEWADLTVRLLKNARLREQLGSQGQNYTLHNRLYETQYEQWQTAYETIMARPVKTPLTNQQLESFALRAATTDTRGVPVAG